MLEVNPITPDHTGPGNSVFKFPIFNSDVRYRLRIIPGRGIGGRFDNLSERFGGNISISVFTNTATSLDTIY
jgi:hypothetical protein